MVTNANPVSNYRGYSENKLTLQWHQNTSEGVAAQHEDFLFATGFPKVRHWIGSKT